MVILYAGQAVCPVVQRCCMLRNSKAESAVQVREVERERELGADVGGGGELRYLLSYKFGQDNRIIC